MGGMDPRADHEPAVRLVTTSLRATWPDEGSVLLAGQWCLDYSERHRDAPFVFTMTPYHWDDRARLRSDYAFLHELSTHLLDELGATLNRIHGQSHTPRFWRIVLGWWLEFFAQVYFDRWKVLESAVATGGRLELVRVPPATVIPAEPTLPDFVQGVLSPHWNERLFADIAVSSFPIDVRPLSEELPSPAPTASSVTASTSVPRALARRLSVRGTRVLDRLVPQRVWMHQTNLRPVPRRLFELAIPQVPRRGETPVLTPCPPRAELREWALAQDHADAFVRGLGRAIAEHLPTVYLENWGASQAAVREALPGAKPPIVLTAVAATHDDAWAIRAASCMEEGSAIVVAQNGGHYGTGAWCTLQDHEVAIADRFLSWGWTDASAPNVRPAPATRLLGQRIHRGAPDGICLQVTVALPQQSYWLYSTPVAGQFLHYINDQITFGQALSAQVRERHRVRLYPQDYAWRVRERWHDADPRVTFTKPTTHMPALLESTRLYVATYNATTFLESMSMGIPTMMFWDPNFWEISDDAAPYFDALRAAGILFDDPVACAHAANTVWPHVEAWWSSGDVAAATTEFVNRFAHVGPHPLRRLRRAVLGGS